MFRFLCVATTRKRACFCLKMVGCFGNRSVSRAVLRVSLHIYGLLVTVSPTNWKLKRTDVGVSSVALRRQRRWQNHSGSRQCADQGHSFTYSSATWVHITDSSFASCSDNYSIDAFRVSLLFKYPLLTFLCNKKQNGNLNALSSNDFTTWFIWCKCSVEYT